MLLSGSLCAASLQELGPFQGRFRGIIWYRMRAARSVTLLGVRTTGCHGDVLWGQSSGALHPPHGNLYT